VNVTDLEPTLLPHTASVLPTVNREPGTVDHAKIQPGSQDFAAVGKIELAYHRIHQAPGEFNPDPYVLFWTPSVLFYCDHEEHEGQVRNRSFRLVRGAPS